MSLIRTGMILVAAVMLLPVEDKNQAEFAATASGTAERSASFCSRNPSTCEAGRELWVLFVRKAEYGMELGARLIREQLIRAASEPAGPLHNVRQPQPLQPPAFGLSARADPVAAVATRQEQPQPRRTAPPVDTAPRWR